MSDPLITVRAAPFKDGAYVGTIYIANGPGGRENLLARLTWSAALEDGRAYFLKHYEPDTAGGWKVREVPAGVQP